MATRIITYRASDVPIPGHGAVAILQFLHDTPKKVGTVRTSMIFSGDDEDECEARATAWLQAELAAERAQQESAEKREAERKAEREARKIKAA